MSEWLERAAAAAERNLWGVEAGIYAVALSGLALAVRSVRPFTKFRRASEVPPGFVRRHVKLSGRVLRLQWEPRPLLVVDHAPLLGWGRRRGGEEAATAPGLPVDLEGLDLSPHAVSWLLSVVVGSDVEFTLLASRPSHVSALVSLRGKSVGNSLVSLGFASVAAHSPDLSSDPLYASYYKTLLRDEARAERNGLGIWWGGPPPPLYYRIFDLLPALRLGA